MRLMAVIWDFNPVFLNLWGLEVRYYGVMWAFAIMIGIMFFTKAFKREGYSPNLSDPLFWYGVLATIIGARLGHCLFYEPEYYLLNPIEILDIRQGGLASHGAAIGLLIGLWLFSSRKKMPYLWSLDRVMVPVALGGAAVRFGNLFNSEIYGTETSAPWGFIFVRMGETVAKHPTQIYEALCYIFIFILLTWLYYRRDAGRRYPGLMFGVGVLGIFLARFLIEYVKNPQEQFEQGMTLLMGQWLSIPFIIVGIFMIAYALQHRKDVVPLKDIKQWKD